jgi:hypothetical protein
VLQLHKLAQLMRKARFDAGALRLDNVKLNFDLDDCGLPTAASPAGAASFPASTPFSHPYILSPVPLPLSFLPSPRRPPVTLPISFRPSSRCPPVPLPLPFCTASRRPPVPLPLPFLPSFHRPPVVLQLPFLPSFRHPPVLLPLPFLPLLAALLSRFPSLPSPLLAALLSCCNSPSFPGGSIVNSNSSPSFLYFLEPAHLASLCSSICLTPSLSCVAFRSRSSSEAGGGRSVVLPFDCRRPLRRAKRSLYDSIPPAIVCRPAEVALDGQSTPSMTA